MFKLPTLQFDVDGLKSLSKRQVLAHYEQHHQHYVDELNKLISGTPFRAATMEEILQYADTLRKQEDDTWHRIFDNATQHYAHSFYWSILGGSGESVLTPEETANLKKACVELFGSGWVVVRKDGTVAVFKNSYVFPPDTILAIDVWEHAYYLDYQADRADYVDKLLAEDINWDQVNQYLSGAETFEVPN